MIRVFGLGLGLGAIGHHGRRRVTARQRSSFPPATARRPLPLKDVSGRSLLGDMERRNREALSPLVNVSWCWLRPSSCLGLPGICERYPARNGAEHTKIRPSSALLPLLLDVGTRQDDLPDGNSRCHGLYSRLVACVCHCAI